MNAHRASRRDYPLMKRSPRPDPVGVGSVKQNITSRVPAAELTWR